MFSVLIPSLKRPDALSYAVEQAYRMAAEKPEILADDKTVGPLGLIYNSLWRACSGDYIVLAADDLVFRAAHWDVTLASAFEEWPDKIGVVSWDDGFGKPSHFCVSREWTMALGYFTPCFFQSFYNDVWIIELAKRVGRFKMLPHVIAEHRSPKNGHGVKDETWYAMRGGKGDRVFKNDIRIFHECRRYFDYDAERLLAKCAST